MFSLLVISLLFDFDVLCFSTYGCINKSLTHLLTSSSLSSSSSSRSPDGLLRSSVTSSNLGPPYCRQWPSISVLDVVEPCAAWATRGPRPGGWWLLARVIVHHQLKGSVCWHTWVQADDVTEQGLATIEQDTYLLWENWCNGFGLYQTRLLRASIKFQSSWTSIVTLGSL